MINDEVIRSDLLSLSPEKFYIKHIVKSYNWYFSEYLKIPDSEIVDKMDCFCEIVSSHLGISFHNCQIVGSAKIGYSLSPRKLLIPFHDGTADTPSSDIDIAIISNGLFVEYWDKLRKTEKLHLKAYYAEITRSIYRGYVNDKQLCKIERIREEWDDKVAIVNKSLQDKLRIEHPVSYRIYRSWEDLEEYQLIGIKQARTMLGG